MVHKGVMTCYIKDYKRILACLHRGLAPKETAFVVKVSERHEYLNLIQENQVDIKGLMGKDYVNYSNIPF